MSDNYIKPIIDAYIYMRHFRLIDFTLEGILFYFLIIAAAFAIMLILKKFNAVFLWITAAVAPFISQIIVLYETSTEAIKTSALFLEIPAIQALLADAEIWHTQIGSAVLYIITAVICTLKYKKNRTEFQEKQSKKMLQNRLDAFLKKNKKLDAKEFIDYHSSMDTVTGVYTWYNKKKKKYYVGEGKNAVSRMADHLIGSNKGNSGVYADYNNGGDPFVAQLFPLSKSKFTSLLAYEEYLIKKYNAMEPNGYNGLGSNSSKKEGLNIINITKKKILDYNEKFKADNKEGIHDDIK